METSRHVQQGMADLFTQKTEDEGVGLSERRDHVELDSRWL